ncbi:hypothetical protein FAZ19_17295 [Sphingobacterium alkalisoli]|uniref:Uncharacterized protein n=1 Tax=Sphingobacterium alkalisoli TaxID=1874115 RepID=A0A4U0GY49_9SPHI|nr:hypothetical protein [Sphingobacterium alkalisoli]TJY64008.1 hypothetical protein FAZ19_17295 [Sphingobacterium alkalisoli]GGH23482.1 hypothetical protein GCM10011418_30710 [Sphingobacterium alkalisoli]
MKTTIITMCLLLCCIVTKTLSQDTKSGEIKTAITEEKLPLYNLFYLSKFMANQNLSFEQKEQVYYALLDLIGKEKIDSIKTTVEVFRFVSNHTTEKEKSIKNRILEELGIGNLKTFQEVAKAIKEKFQIHITDNAPAKKLFESYKTSQEDAEKEIKKLEHIQTEIKSLADDVFALDSIIKGIDQFKNELTISDIKVKLKLSNTDTVIVREAILANSGLFVKDTIYQIDTVKSIYACKISKKQNQRTTIQDTLTNYLSNSKIKLNEFATEIAKHIASQHKAKFNLISETLLQKVSTPVPHISVTTMAQDAQQSLSYSGLNIPSQSQMIEAMAIFLAKRAKQEAAIWFMDQLRERIKNPLVYDSFPETIKLLESLEDYHSPNFGKSWRYAIASDFVEMPKNLVNSTWTEQLLQPDEVNRLRTAVHFGYDIQRLILERYSYRDIIRNLYLDPYYKNADNELTKTLSQSFSLLYVVTNELFTLQQIGDQNNFRLLSYEEINTISPSQWKVLVELLNLKYGNDVKEHLQIVLDAPTKKWLGTLLITLSQFDRINNEQQQLRATNNLDKTDQSFESVWTVLQQVISSFDERQNPLMKTSSTISRHVASVSATLDIIADIQQKSFVAAIQKSLALMDYYYTSGPDNTNILVEMGGSDFKIEKGRMLVRRGNEVVEVKVDPQYIEKLSVSIDSQQLIQVESTQKDKSKSIKFPAIDTVSAAYLKKVSPILSKMNNEDAEKFLENTSSEYITELRFREYLEGLNKKSHVELELVKAIGLYLNLKDTNMNKTLDRVTFLMKNSNFSVSTQPQIRKVDTDTATLTPTLSLKNSVLSLRSNGKSLVSLRINPKGISNITLNKDDNDNLSLSYKLTKDPAEVDAHQLDLSKEKLDMLTKLWQDTKGLKTNLQWKEIRNMASQADSIFLDSLEDKHGKQIVTILHILSVYNKLKINTVLNDITNIIRSNDNNVLALTVQTSLNNLTIADKDKERYSARLIKLVSFFSDVVSTNDANQLANVIESHALPPTSYKMKRKLKTSIDLNAYVGAFGGYMGVCGNSTLNCQWTGGVTAPIGFTFTSALFPSAFKGLFTEPSIHLQLVDLGNIVNHYLVTPDSAYNKDVHFTEVFSPGVNLLFGIRNTPLVVFAGVNGIPLRTHTDRTTNTEMNGKLFDAWVFKAGLKIDIPLVNLYSKTRN